MPNIYIGYDPKEHDAYEVCRHSICKHYKGDDALIIRPLRLRALEAAKLYWRKREPEQSTDFTYSRFLVPKLGKTGWALYMDCDMLVRTDISELFALADPQYAVMVVKHEHEPKEAEKMGGLPQTVYPRKNWSSLMLWNCDHKHVKAINWVNAANMKKGAALHQFWAFKDSEIGSLPVEWNWLEGWNALDECDPKIVHFTRGIPTIHRDCDELPFADEWKREREQIAMGA